MSRTLLDIINKKMQQINESKENVSLKIKAESDDDKEKILAALKKEGCKFKEDADGNIVVDVPADQKEKISEIVSEACPDSDCKCDEEEEDKVEEEGDEDEVKEEEDDDDKLLFMNFEPEAEEAFSMIIPLYINSMIYGGLMQAFASENGARMQAMDSATNNATEMISDLTLKFNRARQSAITQEITEIVGGANAIS